jgi:hypothetical protein
MRGSHICEENMQINILSPDNFITAFLHEKSQNMREGPAMIYLDLLHSLNANFPDRAFHIPSQSCIAKRLRRIRNNGTDNAINMETVCNIQTSRNKTFLRRYSSGEFGENNGRFVVRASNEGLAILRMRSQIFIDATFRVTPSPFSQSLVIMSFDPSTNKHIPCAWALMTSKSEYLYCEILHVICVSLKYFWKPVVVVIDYMRALLNSLRYQFPDSKIVGCYFHFRQGLQRKLAKFGVNMDAARSVMVRIEELIGVEEENLEIELDNLENDQEFASNAFRRFFNYFRRNGH